MWNTGGGQAGGFLSSPSQFSSPKDFSSDKKSDNRTVRRSQNVVPVTIKQILNSLEDGWKIGDTDIHLVTVVGVVKSVEVSATKIIYQIDDHTGILEAIQWLDGDLDDAPPAPSLVENTYCRIVGSVRHQQGNKTNLMMFKSVPLLDLNEITMHVLEVIHADKSLRGMQKKEMEKGSGAGSNSFGNFGVPSNTSFGGPDPGMMGGPMASLNATQQSVYRVIQNCMDDMGVSKQQIFTSVKGRIQSKDVEKILEFLSAEGHIYSTIDDDHYRTTDG